MEWKLLLIGLATAWLLRVVFRQPYAWTGTLYALGMAVGFATQLAIGGRLNRYTPGAGLYLGGVSAAIILGWGVGLTAIRTLGQELRRRFGGSPFLWHSLANLPLITLYEFIGSHLLRMKLEEFERYPSLLPALAIMNAPAWLYGWYFVASSVFYFLAGRLPAFRPLPLRAGLNRSPGWLQRVPLWQKPRCRENSGPEDSIL